MKPIVSIHLKPATLDLSVLEESADFRADFLFLIRLAGTFSQTIFWHAFPRGAMARRKKMFETAKKTIAEDKKLFRAAILDPHVRRAKTTDMFHGGFIALLKELGKDAVIKKMFTDGLKQEHGIFWEYDRYVSSLEALMEKRGYLEHYAERQKKKEVFDKKKNVAVIEALGTLLLPEFCNMLEMSAKSVKALNGAGVLTDMHTVFAWCKQERSKSIQAMFADERKRSKIDKRRRKALAPDADNAQIWLKSYRQLGIASTDYKEFQFKRRYDFIGSQNLRLLFKALGVPLEDKKKPLIFKSGTTPKISFRYDVEPLYFLTMRVGAILHRFLAFAPKNKKGKLDDADTKNIRDTLAHNGLFWRVQKQDKSMMAVEDVFAKVMEPLTAMQASMLCDKVESLLRAQNHAVIHERIDGHPRTKKIKRYNAEQRKQAEQLTETGETTLSHRRALRKIVAGWVRALQATGQAKGLKKAGKNAI